MQLSLCVMKHAVEVVHKARSEHVIAW